MRVISQDGVFWIEEGRIGLTTQFTDKVGVVWNLVPKKGFVKAGAQLKPGQILAHLETNRCLMPLKCPVEGIVFEWNEMALDNPANITNEDWLLRLKENNNAV